MADNGSTNTEDAGVTGVSRREALRKSGIGAGLGAAAVMAPGIAKLSVAPNYASAQSVACPCSTQTVVAVQGQLPVVVNAVVTNNGDGTCVAELSGDLLLAGLGGLVVTLLGEGGPLPLDIALVEDPFGSGVYSGAVEFACEGGDTFTVTGAVLPGFPVDFVPVEIEVCVCA